MKLLRLSQISFNVTALCICICCIICTSGFCITITQSYTHTIQRTHTPKAVTGRVEANKVLSHQRQSNYRKPPAFPSTTFSYVILSPEQHFKPLKISVETTLGNILTFYKSEIKVEMDINILCIII